MISFLRIARVLRVFKLVKTMKGLNKLVITLIKSIPSLFNIALLLGLLFFVFACIGMNLFADIMPGENLNQYANFRKFGTSLLLLFRMSTGEYWNGIMHDCTITPENSDCSMEDGNCGYPVGARIYFFMFIILGQFMLLNLFIAVILEAFGSSEDSEDSFNDEKGEAFIRQWQYLDPEATGWIFTREISTLLKQLQYPMGIHQDPAVTSGQRPEYSGKELDRIVAALNIEEGEGKRAGKVPFSQVMKALAERCMGVPISKELADRVEALQDLEKADLKNRDVSPAFTREHVKNSVAVEIQGITDGYDGKVRGGYTACVKVISVEYKVRWLRPVIDGTPNLPIITNRHVQDQTTVSIELNDKLHKMRFDQKLYEVTWIGDRSRLGEYVVTSVEEVPGGTVTLSNGAKFRNIQADVVFVSVSPHLNGVCKLSNGASFKNPPTQATMSDRYAALMVQKVFRAKKDREALAKRREEAALI